MFGVRTFLAADDDDDIDLGILRQNACSVLILFRGVADRIGAIDLEYVGYAVVALFVVTWLLAVAIWRFGRIEQRWDRRPAAEAVR